MLKHRLSKIGNATLVVLCTLIIGGMFQSCQDWLDDYSYDDGDEPSWLGESVYEFLRNNNSDHTYNYYADIIDSLGEKEQFSKTGSKTVFVADDAAFERFFKDNAWGVTRFEDLTKTQMKIILKASMLNDAMLLEMLSSTSADVNDEGTCLRRATSLEAVDSIPVVKRDETPKYNKFWDALRGKGDLRDDTLLLAKDGTNPMMVHFLPEYMKKNGVSESDISFLLRKNGEQVKTYKEGEAYIYDKKIVASGVPTGSFSDDTMTITCKNGYLYRLDDVLIPPSNMAEEIRLRKNTTIYSHLLDRFCLPYYDKALHDRNISVTGNTDSVFRLRYYTISGGGGISIDDPILDTDNRPKSTEDILKFDPGWNTYQVGTKSAEHDMAAMFVPSDEAMYDYFTAEDRGGMILSVYNKKTDDPDNDYVEIVDYETLMKALDKVPDNIIAQMINMLMIQSFTTYLPSSFDKVTDDNMDRIEGLADAVTESVIANNGVVYIMNKVFAPTRYTMVTAPATIRDNMLIIRNVIAQLGYNKFLLAKNVMYSLFLPDDGSFIYYDPVSIYAHDVDKSQHRKVYEFKYDEFHPEQTDEGKYLYAKIHCVDSLYQVIDTIDVEYTGTINIASNLEYFGGAGASGDPSNFSGFMFNRMSDLLDYLIVEGDITTGQKYYKARNGGALVVDPARIKTQKPIIQGGEQIENGHHVTAKMVSEYDNGYSFNTIQNEERDNKNLYSGLPTPATKSLYMNVKANAANAEAPFYEFYRLMNPTVDGYVMDTLLKYAFDGFATDVQASIYSDSLRAYSTFYTSKDDKNNIDGRFINAVPFFNGFNYTVYIPTNESVKNLIKDNGLPTWEDINAAIRGTGGYDKAPKQAVAVMRLLRSFIRYHFHNNSVFVDNYSASNNYESLLLSSGNAFARVDVQSSNGAMSVTDEFGHTANVITTAGMENKTWNVLCRDFEFYSNGATPVGIPVGIVTSSFSVLHQIDRVLEYKDLYGYDGRIQRFSVDGDRVTTMAVEDGIGTAVDKDGNKILDDDGNQLYLVADRGTVQLVDEENSTSSIRKVGYLMVPRKGNNTKLSRENFVYDEENNKILICNDGYRVERGEYDKVNKTYPYYYYVDSEGNRCKYANDGTIIAKTPNTPSDEENNTDVVE